ncbi:MAG: hypothetical protein LIO90_06370 [Bacteroidales bacterium]|nr:hypothetical protein [Bacteroidales bacterium]
MENSQLYTRSERRGLLIVLVLVILTLGCSTIERYQRATDTFNIPQKVLVKQTPATTSHR